MSYANGTTHYNLPQTVGTDKRDWFDSNAAFAAVDAALYAAATGQAADAEAITALQQTVAGQATDIAGLDTLTGQHTNQIAALNTTVNNLGTEVADVRQDAEDMITANNEGAAATSTRAYAIGDYFIYNDVMYKATAAITIGDTIVPNTNCKATNVDTELTEIHDDLAEHSVIVLADGVKTYSALLDELYARIDTTKLSSKSTLIINENVFSISRMSAGNNFTFGRVVYGVDNMSLGSAKLLESGSVYTNVIITYSNNSIANYNDSANVAGNNTVFKVVY